MDRDSHEMEGSNTCGCAMDQSFTNVFRHYAALQSLNLFACKNLNSQGLVQIADFCPNLEELNIDEVLNFVQYRYRYSFSRLYPLFTGSA